LLILKVIGENSIAKKKKWRTNEEMTKEKMQDDLNGRSRIEISAITPEEAEDLLKFGDSKVRIIVRELMRNNGWQKHPCAPEL